MVGRAPLLSPLACKGTYPLRDRSCGAEAVDRSRGAEAVANPFDAAADPFCERPPIHLGERWLIRLGEQWPNPLSERWPVPLGELWPAAVPASTDFLIID